jgi:tryptophan synthase alpha chain
MNRYIATFTRLKLANRIAFIPFAVAGDPDLDASVKIFKTYIDAGADVLEIGYPFSDPMADGPINQRAAQRALSAGLNHERFFTMISRLRAYAPDVPFGLLMYANSVHHLGAEQFCRKASKAGIDSVLVADMPPEEAGELLTSLKRHNMASVFIATELTTPQRLALICKNTTGFIYVVSRLGTTGVQKDISDSLRPTLQRLRAATDLPLCVGFGLSTPEHVRMVASSGADGAIVGSKLVSIIEGLRGEPSKLFKSLHHAVAEFCKATGRGSAEGKKHAHAKTAS